MFSLNFVLTTGSKPWALRYPEAHELHVLEREAGGASGTDSLEQSRARRRIRVHSDDLAAVR